MIHLLEVSADLAPAQLKKLARRYAMTGGFEINLKEDLTEPDLDRLIELYLPELEKYQGTSAERMNSIAASVLRLVQQHSLLSECSLERLRIFLKAIK